MTPVEQLEARFPYMFGRHTVSMEYYDGWLPIFAQACEQIDAVLGEDKRDFHWVQVKEKFGTGRFYFRMGKSARLVVDLIGGPGGHEVIKESTQAGHSIADRIDAIVDGAEARTGTTCMVCGAAARTRSYNGYYLTVCAAHAPAEQDNRQI